MHFVSQIFKLLTFFTFARAYSLKFSNFFLQTFFDSDDEEGNDEDNEEDFQDTNEPDEISDDQEADNAGNPRTRPKGVARYRSRVNSDNSAESSTVRVQKHRKWAKSAMIFTCRYCGKNDFSQRADLVISIFLESNQNSVNTLIFQKAHIMLVEAPRQRKIGVNVCATDYDKNGKAATYQPGFAPKKRGPKMNKKPL